MYKYIFIASALLILSCELHNDRIPQTNPTPEQQQLFAGTWADTASDKAALMDILNFSNDSFHWITVDTFWRYDISSTAEESEYLDTITIGRHGKWTIEGSTITLTGKQEIKGTWYEYNESFMYDVDLYSIRLNNMSIYIRVDKGPVNRY